MKELHDVFVVQDQEISIKYSVTLQEMFFFLQTVFMPFVIHVSAMMPFYACYTSQLCAKHSCGNMHVMRNDFRSYHFQFVNEREWKTRNFRSKKMNCIHCNLFCRGTGLWCSIMWYLMEYGEQKYNF